VLVSNSDTKENLDITKYKLHLFRQLNPCGVRGRNTKGKIYEIAVFKRVSDSITFDMDGPETTNWRA